MRHVVSGLVALLVLAAAAGCEVVGPTNQFDPGTPADQQAPGTILGRVFVDGRDLDALPVTLAVRDAAGDVVSQGGQPLVITTRGTDDGFPAGFDDDGRGAAGTFAVELVPATYGLTFSAAANGAALATDAAAIGIVVGPGATIRADLHPGVLSVDSFAGAVSVTVEGTSPGRPFFARLKATDAALADKVLALAEDGTFTFSNVAPGVTYQVRTEGEGYAPTATAPVLVPQASIAGAPTSAGTLRLVLTKNLFAIDHRDSEAPFVNERTVPVEFVDSLLLLDASITAVEMRASAVPFADATSGWVSVSDGVDVDLGAAADGPARVSAQLRLCLSTPCDCPADAALCRPPLVSGAADLDVVLDTTPPALVGLTVSGQEAGTVTVACVDFAADCAAAATAQPLVLPVSAQLLDVTGRVTAAGLTFGTTAPTLQSVQAAAGLAVVLPTAPAIAPTDADATLRLFAKDAAGNIAEVGSRAIHIDVTPVALTDGGLVVSGTVPRIVDGTTENVLLDDVVTVDLAATDPTDIAAWEILRDGGPVLSTLGGEARYDGSASVFVTGAHRDTVSLRARAIDDVGNATETGSFFGRVWRAGELVGTALFEGGVRPTFSATLTSSTGSAAGVTTAATGALRFDEVLAGTGTLSLEATGFEAVVIPNVSVGRGAVVNVGTQTLLRERGDLIGRFVLPGSAVHSGIQVSILDDAGAAVGSALTLADGSWRAPNVLAGTGYSAVGFFTSFLPNEVTGLAVTARTTTVVRPDAQNAPQPIELTAIAGDFTLCAPGGFLEDACAAVTATNLNSLRVGGLDAIGFSDFRIGLQAFPPDETGFQPLVPSAGKTVAPVVNVSGAVGTVTVFLQLRAGPGNLGDVLETNVTIDRTPPSAPQLVLQRGAGAILDGFTHESAVTAVVSANAGVGDVAPLGDTFVVFAADAPGAPTGTRCAHDVGCRVPLENLTERLHTAFAFSCDAAGNCTAAPVSSGIVRDVTVPQLNNGVTLAPVGLPQDAGVFFTRSSVYSIDVGVGQARTAGNVNVTDPAGAAVADVQAFRAIAGPATAAGVSFGAIPLTVPGAAANAVVQVGGPGLAAVDGASRVFFELTDAAGNVSDVVNNPNGFKLTLDTGLPDVSMIINASTFFTRSTTVTVAATSPAADLPVTALFSTDAAFSAPVSLAFAASMSFPLPVGVVDGEVTVFGRFFDRAGNFTQLQSNIFLDRTAPGAGADDAGNVVSCSSCLADADGAFTNSATGIVVLELFADDNAGDVAEVRINGAAPVPFGPFVTTQSLGGEGLKNVSVTFIDEASNESAPTLTTLTIDRTAPVPTLSINGGATFTSSSSSTVTLTLGVSNASEVVRAMRIANGAPSGADQPFTSVVPWPLDAPTTDGAKTVTVELVDRAGNRAPLSRTITLDTVAPTTTVQIEGGVARTNKLSVSVSFVGLPTDITAFVLSPNTIQCTSRTTLSAGSPTNLTNIALDATSGDEAELRTVSLCARDAAGNTVLSTDTILVDRSAPSGSLVVNGGAAFATSTLVNAALSGLPPDTAELKTSVDVAPDCAVSTGYVLLAATFTQILPSVAGSHTVFACLRDATGNAIAQPVSDTIVLDLAPPVVGGGGFQINGGVAFTQNKLVTLTLPATDDTGITGVRTQLVDGLVPSTPSFVGAAEPFTDTRSVELANGAAPGPKAVCVELQDGAGRTTVRCASISLDLLPPVGAVQIAGGAAAVTTATPTVLVTGEASTRVFLTVSASAPDCATVTYPTSGVFSAFDGSETTTIGLGVDGVRTVFACFQDGSGRTSLAFDDVVVDTTVPGAPDLQEPRAGTRLQDDTPTFRFSAVNGADRYTVTIRALPAGTNIVGSPFSTTTNELTLSTALSNGDFSWEVVARDNAGNQSGVAGPVTITIDDAPPTAPSGLAVSPATLTNDNTPTLSMNTSTDTQTAAAALTYRLHIADDAGFTNVVRDIARTGIVGATTSFALLNALADGSYAWRVQVTDTTGNSATTNGPAFVIDTTAPAGPALDAVATPTNDTTPSLTWSAVSGATDFLVVVDQTSGPCDAAFTRTSTTTNLTSTTLGALPGGARCQYRASVFARDALQNISGGATANFTIDTQAPVIGGTGLRINGGVSFTNNASLTLLPDAQNAVSVKLALQQTDASGTSACTPAVFNNANFASAVAQPFAPNITFAALPNPLATNQQAAPAGSCKSLAVQFTDDAGNTTVAGATGSVAAIRLDTVLPDAPRIGTQSQIVDAASIEIALAVDSADHLVFTYEGRNGNSAFSALTPQVSCTTPGALTCFNFPLGQDVENRVQIRAIDGAGNISADDFVIVTEDSRAPLKPTLTVTPADRKATLTWTEPPADLERYEVGYGFKVVGSCPTDAAAYDTADFANEGPSPLSVGTSTTATLTGLSNDFEHCFAVRAIDRADHVGVWAAVAATPHEIVLTEVARITAAQLNLGTSPRVGALAVRNGLLYAGATGSAGGLLEVDISNLACFTSGLSDADVRTCAGIQKAPFAFNVAEEMKLHGGFAFVAGGTSGVHIFRLTEGSAPTLFTTIDANALPACSLATTRNALIVGHCASATGTGAGFTKVFNLAPMFPGGLAPTQVGVSLAQDGGSIFGVHAVDAQGNLIAINSTLYDLNLAAVPPLTKRVIQCAETIGIGRLAGGVMYRVNDDNGSDSDFASFQIGFANPHPIDGRASGVAQRRMELVGPYAYVADQTTIDMYDISNPSFPRRVSQRLSVAPFVAPRTRFGAIAAEGNLVFYASGTDGVIRILAAGSPTRIEVLSSVGNPLPGPSVARIGDAWVQGGNINTVNEALVRFGRETQTVLSQAASAATTRVAVEGDQILFTKEVPPAPFDVGQNNFDTLSRTQTGGLSAKQNHLFPPAPGFTPRMVANNGILRWPYVIAHTATSLNADGTGGDNRRGLVATMRLPQVGAAVSADTEEVASTAVNGYRTDRSAAVVVLGGFVYVSVADAVFGGGSGTVTGRGIYRVPFDALTGALGTETQVVTDSTVTGLFAYGRHIYISRNSDNNEDRAILVQASPPSSGVWSPTVIAAGGYAFEHKVEFAGGHMFIPADLDGTVIRSVGFSPTTFAPISSAVVAQLDFGGDAEAFLIAGDRAYAFEVLQGTILMRLK